MKRKRLFLKKLEVLIYIEPMFFKAWAKKGLLEGTQKADGRLRKKTILFILLIMYIC